MGFLSLCAKFSEHGWIRKFSDPGFWRWGLLSPFAALPKSYRVQVVLFGWSSEPRPRRWVEWPGLTPPLTANAEHLCPSKQGLGGVRLEMVWGWLPLAGAPWLGPVCRQGGVAVLRRHGL